MPGPVKALSLEARGELVARALEALDLQDVSLVGHSMGGIIALEVAVRHARRIRSATLVATPGPSAHYPEHAWRGMASVLSLRPFQPALSRVARFAFGRLGFSLRDMTDEGALRIIVDAAHTSFARHRENIATTKVPVLQAWGDDDALVPLRFHEELARARPDWVHLQFPDGGHDVQKFHGVEVADAMRRLIQQS